MHAPIRDGINARPIRIHAAGKALDQVQATLPKLRPELPAAFFRGDIIADDGSPLTPDSSVRAGQVVWAFGGVMDEPAEPITLPIVEENERWLVVDKPHDMATMPRGSHVASTLTVALRRQLENNELVAAHRLDAATAGVVLVTKARQWRGPYQTLFERGLVTKEYLVVADVSALGSQAREHLRERMTVSLRLVKPKGSLTTHTVQGEPNSVTEILCERLGAELGAFRVWPTTGKTHQIRAVFAHLGMPLVGDELYRRRPKKTPLQLLAHSLEFVDPITGENVMARTQRTLALWELAHE